ncbi:MAG: nucleotidyl transferase AbiEii/AbiGii toxin family protein [Candidatus Diapherotrites archaeon]|nr:nucleotidyl transferase AbiEii/AbiGii toxin family protein [Candidatus Diapherotrites archaeon]
MPELSEFVEFVDEKASVKKPSLVEKDILIHGILNEIVSSELGKLYLFKGGSCLVKCYFGYYRFSVDLDFTWRDQSVWSDLGKKSLRRKLLEQTERFARILERAAKKFALDFKSEIGNKKYVEFGSGNRMVTFKMWKDSELIKAQLSFVEKLLFKHKSIVAGTLLRGCKLLENERAYFADFLEFYRPIKVLAYSKEEILCEKVRAMLTRRNQKLRDFYDVFMLEKGGIKVESLKEEIVEKIKEALSYKKYKTNLERNLKALSLDGLLSERFEREMFVVTPPAEFYKFMEEFEEALKEVGLAAMQYRSKGDTYYKLREKSS